MRRSPASRRPNRARHTSIMGVGMAMRRFGITAIVSLLVLGLASPPAAMADVCGASATIEPSSGPPGTTFMFRTNQGAPTNLYVYRDGKLVRTAKLAGDGFVFYQIRTSSGDAGQWRARAAVQGHEECYGEATFRVTNMPDTSTVQKTAGWSPWPLMVALGLLAFLLVWRRSPATRHR